jgi:hypothetical protein
MKFIDGYDVPLADATIDDMGSWAHVDITRNSTTGCINVYFNATSSIAEPDISHVDNDYNYSEVFVMAHDRNGFRFDNIVVDNETLITPVISTPTPTPSPTPTQSTTPTNGNGEPPDMTMMYLIAGGGVAVIVVLVIVVKMRSS